MAGNRPEGLDIKISGVEGLSKALQKLGNNVEQRVTKKSVKKASKIFEGAWRANLAGHEVTGLLRVSVGIRARTYAGGNIVMSIVGYRREGFEGHYRLGHLIEWGTRYARAFHPAEHAFDANKGLVEQTVKVEMGKGFESEARKLKSEARIGESRGT